MDNSGLLSSLRGVALVFVCASVAGSCGGSTAGSGGGGGSGGSGGSNGSGGSAGSAGSGGSAGQAGADAGGETDGGPPAACTTISSFGTHLPHVSATGAKATAVSQAVTAILAAQAMPVQASAPYVIPRLGCRDNPPPIPLFPGGEPAGYTCGFQIQVGGGKPVDVKVDPPSTLAETLFKALADAGAGVCDPNDPTNKGGAHVDVENLSVGATDVQFDDGGMFTVPQPNVVAHGAEAQAVVAALKQAGINDCDPTRKAFLICNRLGGAPSCGYQRLRLDMAGSSYLIPTCGLNESTFPGGDISPAAAAVLWQAVLAAAQAAGFQPESGTIAQTTVVNARWFNWDGSTLKFLLITGDVAGPPGATN